MLWQFRTALLKNKPLTLRTPIILTQRSLSTTKNTLAPPPTTKMPTNRAAWLPASDGSPLRVSPAPYTAPAANELTIKTAAVAVNPVEGRLQMTAYLPIPQPAIMGLDVVGTVYEVGPGTTRFKPGDRVLGCPIWFNNRETRHGAFQEYATLVENMAAPIPDAVAFEDAVVIPLGLSTAAAGLFQKDFLALEYPSLKPAAQGKTVLVWGGATSVGTAAIQLAVAAGYEVFATASPKNWDLCKRLGASKVFDYNSGSVVEELVKAFEGKESAGAIDTANRDEKMLVTAEVMAKAKGNKFVASVGSRYTPLPEGVSSKFVFGSSIAGNEVSKVVYEQYLPQALAQGKFVSEPKPDVVGEGLESLQNALELRRAGNVSARKLVVKI